MKVLKITTHWTPEEADCIVRLLDEIQCAIWEGYGKDIEQLYQEHREEQMELKMEQGKEGSPLDEIPF